MLTGEHLSGAAEAALHFVGDEHDAMLVANLHQDAEKLRWGRDEAAFSENRLNDYGGDVFGGDHTAECVFQMPCAKNIAGRMLQRIRAAVAIRIRNAIHVAG